MSTFEIDVARVFDKKRIFGEQQGAESQQSSSTAQGATTETLLLLSDVKPKKLRWSWHSRVPLGKVSLLEGDPGLGKSLITIEMAAALTTGRPMPNAAMAEMDPAGVVFLSAEDDAEDTIQPRAELAGCDMSKIVLLTAVKDEYGEHMPTIANLQSIKNAIKKVNAKMVVIDPLMAYLPAETNSYRDQDVRRALAPLSALAGEMEVSIVLIRHLNKTSATNPLYRGGGSIGIIGAARGAMLVTRDPDDDSKFVLSVSKSNLAKHPPSLSYSIGSNVNEVPFLMWHGQTTHTAASLLSDQQDNSEDRSAIKEAENFLSEYLKHTPRKVPDVFKAARAAGIAEKTLRRAKSVRRVKAVKSAFDDGWMWELPKMANLHEDGQK